MKSTVRLQVLDGAAASCHFECFSSAVLGSAYVLRGQFTFKVS